MLKIWFLIDLSKCHLIFFSQNVNKITFCTGLMIHGVVKVGGVNEELGILGDVHYTKDWPILYTFQPIHIHFISCIYYYSSRPFGPSLSPSLFLSPSLSPSLSRALWHPVSELPIRGGGLCWTKQGVWEKEGCLNKRTILFWKKTHLLIQLGWDVFYNMLF